MRKAKWVPWVGLVVLAGLTVAGCGGGGSGGGGNGSGNGGGGTTTTPVYDTAKFDTDKWG